MFADTIQLLYWAIFSWRATHNYVFYPFSRAIAECFAHVSHHLGVRLSVRSSRCAIVSKRHKLGSRDLHCGLLKDSSLSWQNFVPMGMGVLFERGRQRGVLPKKDVIMPFLAHMMWKWVQIDTDLLHIITCTGDRPFRFINIDDLEPSPPKGFLLIFHTIFGCSVHFITELRQNGWR